MSSTNCIIGIAGGSASGKTTIAKKLSEMSNTFGNLTSIKLDNYYLDRSNIPVSERDIINYDHPDSFDVELLLDHLTKLKNGEPIEMPIYDFATHTRKEVYEHVVPTSVIVIEGIMLLAIDKLEKLIDIKIYVETPDDIRFIRRLKRDILERHRTVESVINQYINFVRPMHELFVNPSKSKAHIIVPEGGENNVAINMLYHTIMEIIDKNSK